MLKIVYSTSTQFLFMSAHEDKGFFTIVEQVNESNYKIQENIPNAVEESIDIAQSSPAKTQDGKAVTLFKTLQGRQFARLEDWPKNLLLEVKKS